MNIPLPWIILLLPLLSAVIITLFTQHNERVSAALSVAAIATSFVLSLVLFAGAHSAPTEFATNWLSVGDLQIDFGLRLDPLGLLMLLIVTGVGSAIHLYSVGYMHGDRSFSRFFACLS